MPGAPSNEQTQSLSINCLDHSQPTSPILGSLSLAECYSNCTLTLNKVLPDTRPFDSNMSAPHSVAVALKTIRDRLTSLSTTMHLPTPPQLIAVSKTKPASLLLEAYQAGQRAFGENYVVELVEKAPELPKDVRWHFVGHLQSNKAKVLVKGVPHLYMVESVDNEKLATALNKACQCSTTRTGEVLSQVCEAV